MAIRKTKKYFIFVHEKAAAINEIQKRHLSCFKERHGKLRRKATANRVKESKQTQQRQRFDELANSAETRLVNRTRRKNKKMPKTVHFHVACSSWKIWPQGTGCQWAFQHNN